MWWWHIHPRRRSWVICAHVWRYLGTRSLKKGCFIFLEKSRWRTSRIVRIRIPCVKRQVLKIEKNNTASGTSRTSSILGSLLFLHKMSRRGWRHHGYNRWRIRNCLHRQWRLNVWIDCYRWWWLDGNRTVLLNTRTQRFYRAHENAVVELQNFLIFAVRNLPGNVKNSFSSSISLITYRMLNFYWVIKFYLSEETWPTIDSFGGIFHNVQPLKSRSE